MFSSLICCTKKRCSPENSGGAFVAVMKLEVSSVGGTQTRLGVKLQIFFDLYLETRGDDPIWWTSFSDGGWNQQVDDKIQLYAGFPHFLEINLMRALFEQKNPEETTFAKQKNKHITHQSIHLGIFTPPKDWQPKPMMGKGRRFRLSLWVICP